MRESADCRDEIAALLPSNIRSTNAQRKENFTNSESA